MSLVNMKTRVVLDSLVGSEAPANAHLSNASKQVYKLAIIEIAPDEPAIRFQAPRGRRSPIDPLDEWELLLRDDKGAYVANVRTLIPNEDTLECKISDDIRFLARRHSIRLEADSRSPITVNFNIDDKAYQGDLVDLCLHGLGILAPSDRAWKPGDILKVGQFELRGYQVRFETARVAHCHAEEGKTRLGLTFLDLSPGQKQIIQKTFDAWHLSQRSSFTDSKALDG